MLNDFGRRLQKARREAGFKTAEETLTRYPSWHKHAYLSHEIGRRIPRDPTLQKYADAFNVRLEWLRFGVEPMRDVKYPEGNAQVAAIADSPLPYKRRLVFEALDLWEKMSALEQREFLALAAIHDKNEESDGVRKHQMSLPLREETDGDKIGRTHPRPDHQPGKKAKK